MIDQTAGLLGFLSAVAREVGSEPIRDVQQQDLTLWPSDIPAHSSVTLGPSDTRGSWLAVQRLPLPEPPRLPEHLKPLVDPLSIQVPADRPKFLEHRVNEKILADARQLDPQWLKDAETQVVGIHKEEIHATNFAEQTDIEERVMERHKHHRTELTQKLNAQLDRWRESDWKEWVKESTPVFRSRALYSKLFELHLRLEAEQATLETQWGHSLFSYRSPEAKTINAPMFTVPVSIAIDSVSGAISVTPESLVSLDLTALEGAGVPGLEVLQALQGIYSDEPPNVWSEVDRLHARQQIIAPMGVDARLSDISTIETPTHVPSLNDGWVLYTRKRPLRQERFYGALAEKIEEESFVPEALASIVADKDAVDRALVSAGRPVNDNDGTADRLLMPLPTNADQERIAHQIAASRGITVQGPPGTGKSHTIVNLISHLVAQGKRILVTAENDQALAVVREKIPEQLRDLSIAVLGSTPAALDELRNSARSMKDSLSSIGSQKDEDRLTEIGNRVDELREETRQADLDLIDALRTEQQEFTIEGGSKLAADVALWITQHQHLGYIKGRANLNQDFPLTDNEVREIQVLAQEIADQDANLSKSELPIHDWLWSSARLHNVFEELDTLRRDLTELKGEGLNVSVIEALKDDEIQGLSTRMRAEANQLTLLQGTWEAQLTAHIRSTTQIAQWTVTQNDMMRPKLDQAQEIMRQLAGQDIVLPQGDPNLQTNLINVWRTRLEQGKKLPVFGAKDLKQFAEAVKISGYPITTAHQLYFVQLHLHFRELQHEIKRLMHGAYDPLGIPVPQIGSTFLLEALQTHERIDSINRWWTHTYPELSGMISGMFSFENPAETSEGLKRALLLLEGVHTHRREKELSNVLAKFNQQVQEFSTQPTSSHLWSTLWQALESKDVERWTAVHEEAQRLKIVRQQVERRDGLQQRLELVGAGSWARAIIDSNGSQEVVGDPLEAPLAWEYAQARTWLEELHSGPEIDSLMTKAHSVSAELQQQVIAYTSLSARLRLKENMKDPQRRALETWLTAIGRVGKGTGKNAPRFQAQARDALPAAMGAVPIWIMPIYRVLENFDPRLSEMFDVVIVDESSQCDLLSLGVLALGRKSVVVGDDKQTSPQAVGINTERIFELQKQYIADLPDRALFTMQESLYSISARAFPSTILLREHFRSVPEVIRFSNRFYGNQILPLREVTKPQIGDPLRAVYVKDAISERRGAQRINQREAERLVEQVAACVADPRYDGLSFGVVTMMSGPQSKIIESLLMEELGLDEFEKRKMRVGNPPTFQGDERNVMFISFVTHEHSYAATRERDAQWANVAASRARDQLWLFYSVDPSALNENDYRRAMIDYVLSVDRATEDRDLFSLTKNAFQREVLQEIMQRGYQVTPQHQVGNFYIDFVVTLGEGERLAIECDGGTYQAPGQLEQAVNKQRVLERLGWNFWRIRASEFNLDREAVLNPLWNRLEEMKTRLDARSRFEALRVSLQEQQKEQPKQQTYFPVQPGAEAESPPFLTTSEDVPAKDFDAVEEITGADPTVTKKSDAPGEDPPAPSTSVNTTPSSGFVYKAPLKAVDRKTITAQAAPKTTATQASTTEPTADRKTTAVRKNTAAKKTVLDGAPATTFATAKTPPRAKTFEINRTPLKKEAVDPPEKVEIAEAWKDGTRYRLTYQDLVQHVRSKEYLSEFLGVDELRPAVQHMRRLRPEGGIFKVDDNGLLVTLINGTPTFVNYVSWNEHFSE